MQAFVLVPKEQQVNFDARVVECTSLDEVMSTSIIDFKIPRTGGCFGAMMWFLWSIKWLGRWEREDASRCITGRHRVKEGLPHRLLWKRMTWMIHRLSHLKMLMLKMRLLMMWLIMMRSIKRALTKRSHHRGGRSSSNSIIKVFIIRICTSA